MPSPFRKHPQNYSPTDFNELADWRAVGRAANAVLTRVLAAQGDAAEPEIVALQHEIAFLLCSAANKSRAMHNTGTERGAEPPGVFATLIRPISGAFCEFRAGELVKVTQDYGDTVTIEREPWAGSKVTIANVLTAVPRAALKFSA